MMLWLNLIGDIEISIKPELVQRILPSDSKGFIVYTKRDEAFLCKEVYAERPITLKQAKYLAKIIGQPLQLQT